MRIAYQKLNLADARVRERLFDDLIKEAGVDDTHRQYIEDVRDFVEELIEENDHYIEREKEWQND